MRRDRLALVGVLLAAAVLRVWGIGFALPHTLGRPDEDAVASIALRFFKREFNPQFFDWPSLFTSVVAVGYAVYFNVGRAIGWFSYEATFISVAATTPAPLFLIARGLSAAAGVATVGVVYAIGVRLFDRATALTGAAFMAVAALHVRDSHFGVTDVPATCALTVSVYFTTRFATGGLVRDALWSAVWAGIAASTKYNAGVAALPGLWAILAAGATETRSAPATRRLVLLYIVLAAAAFVAGTPYAVLDFGAFATALRAVGAHLEGGHAALAGPAWFVHLTSSLRYGVGVPMVAAGVAGLLLYVWRDARAGLRFVLLPVVYFVLIGGGQTAFARHIIPTLPFLCLGAAYCARELARTMERLMPSRVPAALPGLVIAAIVALPSARSSIETDRLLSRTDSRLLAADWILEQFPDGVTIYQSGSSYAQVQFPVLADRGTPRFREVGFDEPSGSFLTRDGVSAEPPDLIVRPRCALSYCDVPPRLTAVLAGYTLLATIVAVDPTAGSQLVYDRDDAFFVPLAGFAGALRPGPDELIYGRRSTP